MGFCAEDTGFVQSVHGKLEENEIDGRGGK
jgi:hypothetical protein